MHGSRALRLWCVAVGLGSLVGCGDGIVPAAATADADEATRPVLATAFAPGNTGTLTGRVLWAGAVPAVEPLTVPLNVMFEPAWDARQREKRFPNPNAPAVDPSGRGVADAVVFLRRVDPERSRPWDHPPVTVELRDYRLAVRQGGAAHPAGFVRRGDEVAFRAGERRFHILRARGAAFFSLTLPQPDRPRTRRLAEPGVVELSDAAEYYWLRGYLFVADHPYYTRTDAEGRFTLGQVPPGDYELVAWLPSWVEAGHERNPETMRVSRLFFRPPVEQTQPVRVTPQETTPAEFHFRTELFTGGS